ncbi:unnamed protein product [Darwinula stevensoni]|uniref:Uncharacterized protein n=1 Tax=Darwinula stevensoni TaxID=69355 RepID=A0A7R9ACI8_9CRUS|nr:unnamed protein product [Darwinula stevensoni]CAG0900143.1 unnamed protein product [Darwinula stevensoni]
MGSPGTDRGDTLYVRRELPSISVSPPTKLECYVRQRVMEVEAAAGSEKSPPPAPPFRPSNEDMAFAEPQHHVRHHRHHHHYRRKKRKGEEEEDEGRKRKHERSSAGITLSTMKPKLLRTVADLWPTYWETYEGHPEQDSLDGNVPSGSNTAQGGFSTDPGGNHNNTSSSLQKKKDLGTFSSALVPSSGLKRSKHKKKHKKTILSTSDSLAEPIEMHSGGIRDKRQPRPWIWVSLSAMYGKLIVLCALAFCLTEVMDNSVKPLQYQGIFVMYLYVGSIISIMCIYITVLVDNCPSLTKGSREELAAAEEGEVESTRGGTGGDSGGGTLRNWSGTLRRAHISRSRISRTSFYLRVGAIVFGLGTLVFTGLEIAMHTTTEERCVSDIIFAHPILQALFTFLQMHFLFVNSEVIVERFGVAARFGLIHLVATNVALWIQMVVWESANDWLRWTYDTIQVKGHSVVERDLPASTSQHLLALPKDQLPDSAVRDCECNGTMYGSISHAQKMIDLYECLNRNKLGQIWSSSTPYLFPFIVEYRLKVAIHFSLIAAAVTYIMWKNVGKAKEGRETGLSKAKLSGLASDLAGDGTLDPRKRSQGHWKVDCQSSSKGLFLGLLCLVGGVVVLIIFYIMKGHFEAKEQLFYMYTITEISLLGLCILVSIVGFIQIPKLSLSGKKPLDLDRLLSSTTIVGVYVFAIFGILVGVSGKIEENPHILLISLQGLQIIQVSMQALLTNEASRRTCLTRQEMRTKPGRQVVTFLLFGNATLWLLDTFLTHDVVAQELQIAFYGNLTWGIICRISLPLLIFYRFYSSVALIEIWKNTYKTKTD